MAISNFIQKKDFVWDKGLEDEKTKSFVWDDYHMAYADITYVRDGQEVANRIRLWIHPNKPNKIEVNFDYYVEAPQSDYQFILDAYQKIASKHFAERPQQVLNYKQKQYANLWVHSFINELRALDKDKRKLSQLEVSISLQDYLKPQVKIYDDDNIYVVTYCYGQKITISDHHRYYGKRKYSLYASRGRSSKCSDAKGVYASISRKSVKNADAYVSTQIQRVKSANDSILREILLKEEFAKDFPELKVEVAGSSAMIHAGTELYSISKNGIGAGNEPLWNFHYFRALSKAQVLAIIDVVNPKEVK